MSGGRTVLSRITGIDFLLEELAAAPMMKIKQELITKRARMQKPQPQLICKNYYRYTTGYVAWPFRAAGSLAGDELIQVAIACDSWCCHGFLYFSWYGSCSRLLADV